MTDETNSLKKYMSAYGDPSIADDLQRFLNSLLPITVRCEIETPSGKRPSPKNTLPDKIYMRSPRYIGTLHPRFDKNSVQEGAWLYFDNIDDECRYRPQRNDKDAFLHYKNGVLAKFPESKKSIRLRSLLDLPELWQKSINELIG